MCRRRLPEGSGPPTENDVMNTETAEKVLLDENVEAAGHTYFDLGGFQVNALLHGPCWSCAKTANSLVMAQAPARKPPMSPLCRCRQTTDFWHTQLTFPGMRATRSMSKISRRTVSGAWIQCTPPLGNLHGAWTTAICSSQQWCALRLPAQATMRLLLDWHHVPTSLAESRSTVSASVGY